MAFHLRACTAAFTIPLLVAGCSTPESLCPPKTIGMWSAEGETEIYVGDDLFIYTMDGDAFGIYSFARSSSGHAVKLGNGGTSADYYLHFWSGPELAVITAESEFDDLGAAVLEIGTAIAGCLRVGGVEPDLLDQLPNDGRVPGSEVYFTGRLAILNVARPAAVLFTGFEEPGDVG